MQCNSCVSFVSCVSCFQLHWYCNNNPTANLKLAHGCVKSSCNIGLGSQLVIVTIASRDENLHIDAWCRSQCNTSASIVFCSAVERILGMAAANGVHQLQLHCSALQNEKCTSSACIVTTLLHCNLLSALHLKIVHCTATASKDCTLHPDASCTPLVHLHTAACLRAHHQLTPFHLMMNRTVPGAPEL